MSLGVEKMPVPGSKGLGKNYKIVATDNETMGSGPGDWPNRSGRSLRLFRGLGTHIKCYRCHAANCSLDNEPMQCDNAYLKKHMSLFAQVACTASCQGSLEKNKYV